MWLLYLLLVVIVIAGSVYFWQNIRPNINTRRNLSTLGSEAPARTQDGIKFRDLNKNGKLDIYEDPRRPIEERVEDLLSQMTLEEKAGMMFQTRIGMNKDGTIVEKTGMFPLPQTSDMIARRLMNHFNILEIFELPSSMETVKKQKEDVPYDSENPFFKFGHGLSY